MPVQYVITGPVSWKIVIESAGQMEQAPILSLYCMPIYGS